MHAKSRIGLFPSYGYLGKHFSQRTVGYLVIAYPQLAPDDFKKIQLYRERHDLLFNVVEPHFTIVFPVLDLQLQDFMEEIEGHAKNISRFDFAIRCATINKDAFNKLFHVFLVPDEGYSRVVRMHDTLYRGRLKPYLRLDLDYIPHITIGNCRDKHQCKEMVDEWNKEEFLIRGTISGLTVVKYADGIVTKLKTVDLK
jgi:hypothetical protein